MDFRPVHACVHVTMAMHCLPAMPGRCKVKGMGGELIPTDRSQSGERHRPATGSVGATFKLNVGSACQPPLACLRCVSQLWLAAQVSGIPCCCVEWFQTNSAQAAQHREVTHLPQMETCSKNHNCEVGPVIARTTTRVRGCARPIFQGTPLFKPVDCNPVPTPVSRQSTHLGVQNASEDAHAQVQPFGKKDKTVMGRTGIGDLAKYEVDTALKVVHNTSHQPSWSSSVKMAPTAYEIPVTWYAVLKPSWKCSIKLVEVVKVKSAVVARATHARMYLHTKTMAPYLLDAYRVLANITLHVRAIVAARAPQERKISFVLVHATFLALATPYLRSNGLHLWFAGKPPNTGAPTTHVSCADSESTTHQYVSERIALAKVCGGESEQRLPALPPYSVPSPTSGC